MSTELATIGPSHGALSLAGDQVEWTPVQQAALAHIGIADAPAADQQVFLHVCQRVGLDPFAKQIYMIKRTEKGKDKWTIQTAIDGFRLVAEDHPQYAGTLDPEWCGPDGVWRPVWTGQKPPVAARVVVLRHDRANPISLPVLFSEFASTFSDGNLMGQWRSKPAHMIAKCAEAAALRKAFPRQLSGVYTDDEMDHVERAGGRGRAQGAASVAPSVTAAELTGEAVAAPVTIDAEVVEDAPVTEAPAPEAAAASSSPATADESDTAASAPGDGPKPSSPQMKKIFACIRDAGIENRNEWATGILGREITTFGQLDADDAKLLIDRLEEGLAALAGEREPDGADPAGADQ